MTDTGAPGSGADAAPDTTDRTTNISMSRGFPDWLARNRVALAISSYQSGELFLIGARGDGQLSVHQENFVRAMGVCALPQRIYLGSLNQIWRLENVLAPDQRANDYFDRLYVPRNAQTTGDVDIHELAVEPSGRILFINTKFSCVATVSSVHGFTPLWKPPFVTRLAAEDRCHLNGLCMADGKLKYVSAISQSDVVDGWRERRHEGGVLIDVTSDKVITDRLSMPHSPRLYKNTLWVLDSGREYLSRVDLNTGKAEDLTFCPGFARGLSMIGNFAIVGLSLPRDGSFEGLQLQENLAAHDAEPRCAVHVIDLTSGDTVHWLRFSGYIQELFDVSVISGVTCPMAVGVNSPDLSTLITYEPVTTGL